jgi:hypothetical protein
MYGESILVRIVEVGAGIAAIVLYLLIWRTTRIGGFGLMAALRVAALLQWLLLTVFASSGFGGFGSFATYISMALSIGYALALWNIYTHMRRIWAPVETPAANSTIT